MAEIGYHELERVALAFVLEDQTWPVFAEWVRTRPHSPKLISFVDGADLDLMRREWLAHSDFPLVRARGWV